MYGTYLINLNFQILILDSRSTVNYPIGTNAIWEAHSQANI